MVIIMDSMTLVRALGLAVYLCAIGEDGNGVSNLGMVKSRVASAITVTLLRLERLAAYITSSPNLSGCSLRLIG